MGLFSKRVQQIVPPAILNSLAEYGDACLKARQTGQPGHLLGVLARVRFRCEGGPR